MQTKSRFVAILLAFATAIPAFAAAGETMPLSQIRKGMKGYGLTVFEGTQLEKFDVEILGVLNNIGPGQNLIMAHVDSAVVRRAGVIAGMSGSPIYIDGKVIGALAYAWQFAKEPVAGITPIEEMLKIADAGTPGAALTAAAPRMSAPEFLNAMTAGNTVAAFEKIAGAKAMASLGGARPIAVPLALSSFAPETIERFSKTIESMGFVAVPSGSSAAAGASGSSAATAGNFAPGDPIGAVLLSGDFNVAATGTVTHVEGNRVWAFGHPFLDMGSVSFPMAKSEIVTVMPSLASSFKLANTGAIVGALQQDRASGIMGVYGEKAETIPMELTVEGTGPERTYHVNVVRHTQLSPLIMAMAVDSVVANAQRAAGERTVVLDSEIKLKGFEPVHLREGWAGAQARQAIPAYLAVVAQYLMSNEFRDTTIESVKVHLHHDDQLRIAKLLEASVDTPADGRFSPGDTVRLRMLLKPFRGEAFTETLDIAIPDDQTPGSAYLLIGSGSLMNQIDFSLVPPDPRTLEQVLDVLARLRPSTDLTAGLYSAGEGSVTAGVYMPSLPPTITAVVSNDTSNSSRAPVKYYAAARQSRSLGYIVDGAVKIDLEIKPKS